MTAIEPLAIRGDVNAGDGNFDAALGPDGIIGVTIRGLWTNQQVDRFFTATEPLRKAARASGNRALQLVMVETVQPPAVALHVRNCTVAVKLPGDRNAFVVASQLSKLQITRLATT
ncbi:hypothetical protein ACWTQY_27565, partial [Klebsiella pneumoniae]